MSKKHLAQANVARQRAALESPQMGEFLLALDPVYRIAEQSPGFVRRLRYLRAYGPSPRAFTLRRRLGPDGSPEGRRRRPG